MPGGLANAESDSFNEWREQLVDIMMVAVEDDDLPAVFQRQLLECGRRGVPRSLP